MPKKAKESERFRKNLKKPNRNPLWAVSGSGENGIANLQSTRAAAHRMKAAEPAAQDYNQFARLRSCKKLVIKEGQTEPESNGFGHRPRGEGQKG